MDVPLLRNSNGFSNGTLKTRRTEEPILLRIGYNYDFEGFATHFLRIESRRARSEFEREVANEHLGLAYHVQANLQSARMKTSGPIEVILWR
jgi:hypothetical protein